MRFRQQRGREGEDVAVAFLIAQKYQLTSRNWRPSHGGLRGEVDIIAWDPVGRERTLCFIEVKTRDIGGGSPQEAVNRAKQLQLSRLANAYVSVHVGREVPCRFDVVEVWLAQAPALPRVALHRGAFDYQSGIERGRFA